MTDKNKQELKLHSKNENNNYMNKFKNHQPTVMNYSKNDKFLEENSKGFCYICQQEISGSEIKRHLMTSCFNKLIGKNEAFLLKASAGPYWIYFTIPKEKIQSKIHTPLQKLWASWYKNLSPCKIYYNKKRTLDKEKEIAGKDEFEIENKEEFAIEFISHIKLRSNKMLILAKNKEPTIKKQ
ncbi:MAG: hypothetical protein ACOCQG_00675 [Candidatus Nanoarchaeia archaeon]